MLNAIRYGRDERKVALFVDVKQVKTATRAEKLGPTRVPLSPPGYCISGTSRALHEWLRQMAGFVVIPGSGLGAIGPAAIERLLARARLNPE